MKKEFCMSSSYFGKNVEISVNQCRSIW